MSWIKDRWNALVGATNDAANALGLKDDAAKQRMEDLSALTVDEINQIPLPVIEQLKLENPEWLSDLAAAKQGRTDLDSISVDPRYKEAQLAALSSLENVANSGGMTAQDEANLARIQSQVATADRGRREAIKQNMAVRGMGGSGQELLAQLQSSQDATNMQSQRGLDVAGMAQQRALDAMMQSGQLSGSMRGQEYGEQSNRAQAQDAINRFNTANQNQAAQYNNAGRQQIHNQGIATQNQAAQYNNGMGQQNFNNAMSQVAAKGGARGQQINVVGQNSRDNLNTNANMWGAATKAGTKLASWLSEDEE